MPHQYRRTQPQDIHQLFDVRASTRENPISSERLATLGITPDSTKEALGNGDAVSWVCIAEDRVVGFCTGDVHSGEVLVLAVLPEFEGQGIGKTLLLKVTDELLRYNHESLWLAADSNPRVRSHGFYRKLGWQPTGKTLENGDEILSFSATVNKAKQ